MPQTSRPRAAVASYFNPVKLVDRNTSSKGLDDVGKGPQSTTVEENDKKKQTDKPAGAENQQSGPAQNEAGTEMSETPKHSDQNFFSNPYAVLAEIAAETGTLQNLSSKGAGGAQEAGPATGASGGESYRDPFAPDFWAKQVDSPSDLEQRVGSDPTGTGKSTDQQIEAYLDHAPSPNPDASAQDRDKQPDQAAQPKPEGDKAAAKPAPKADAATSAAAKNAAEAAAVKQELAAAFGAQSLPAGFGVEPTDKGVMISITEDARDGMFEIGSAVPRPELVRAMEKVGETLATRKGPIVISGHTDARPYTGGNYDNWRLSSARAQSAYYMLVRGGLPEKRVLEVAGFADRRPKVPDDPFAAANRRIEILLEPGG